MAQTYKKRIQIRFRDADPARILYFGNVFSLAHDTLEDFIQAAGFTWDEWFQKNAYIIPIRHAESDFLAPFVPGQFYEVQAEVAGFRETSFQMKYTFRQGDKVHAVVKMVHSFLDSKTMQKTAIPDSFKNRLSPYLEQT